MHSLSCQLVFSLTSRNLITFETIIPLMSLGFFSY